MVDTCNAQNDCYDAAVKSFNDHKTATETLIKKWKVEYAALKKISCYVDVWLNNGDANTVDANQLSTCESSNVDTSPMDIDFHNAPAKNACPVASVANHPGTPAFVKNEYSTLKDTIEPVACLS